MNEELKKAAEEFVKDFANRVFYETDVNDEIDLSEQVKRTFIAGAKWQAEQLLKSSPLPEDTVLFNKGVEEGKRLMMEEAVEGEIQMRYSGCLCAKTIRAINEDKFKFGDKVRIIVIPNTDEK